MTIMGALLTAGVVAGCIFIGNIAMSRLMMRSLIFGLKAPSAADYRYALLVPVGLAVVAVPLCYFLLIGFSEQLARRVDFVRHFGDFNTRYGSIEPGRQYWLWFTLMIATPIFVALYLTVARATTLIRQLRE